MVRRKSLIRDIARQRSLILYTLAVRCVKENKLDRARKYVMRGVRILLKARARKPVLYRRWICDKCYVPLVPGVTARVRIRGSRSHLTIVKKCLMCGWINRTVVSRKRPSGIIDGVNVRC
ncbi:MAG: hypothetical protein QW543_03160 [Sulfolobales archaeon]